MLIKAVREVYYGLPVELQNAILVKRRARIWLGAGIAFVHIPKAAGTSISEALYGRFLGHVTALDIQRWGSAKLRALPSFAITRNPWDRLVSAYRYGRRLHTHDWRTNQSVPRIVRNQVPQLDSFAEFVVEWLQQRDITKLNAIYQPQTAFICDRDGCVLVDHIGRFDRLSATRTFLQRQLGMTFDIGDWNRSGAPVDYRTFYTPTLVDLVGKLYAEDVERFGYKFDAD